MCTTGNSKYQAAGAANSPDECLAWQGLLERIPYARHLGLQAQTDNGGVLIHLPYREALIGNFKLPALHGGVLAALIELTARTAAQRRDKDDRCPRILDSHINYLRSAAILPTFASAEIIRQGRRTSLVEVMCWQDNRAAPIASGRVQLLLPAVVATNTEAQEQ